MEIENKIGCSLASILIIICLLFTIGWILNIVKLTKLDFKAPYKAEVIRIIGITPPVGGIVGYLKITDN